MSKNTSLLKRVDDAIQAIHVAFGAPGDWGYETPKGSALFELYKLTPVVATARAAVPASDAPIEERLASCLAAAIDTPLLTVREIGNGHPVELHLGSFNAEISERAAQLLAECET